MKRADDALPTNKRSLKSFVLERSFVSGTQRSSLSMISTRAHSISAVQSASKIGPGVLPPGTTKTARFFFLSAARKSASILWARLIARNSLSGYSIKKLTILSICDYLFR